MIERNKNKMNRLLKNKLHLPISDIILLIPDLLDDPSSTKELTYDIEMDDNVIIKVYWKIDKVKLLYRIDRYDVLNIKLN